MRRSSWHHRRHEQLFESDGVERITFWLSCCRVNAARKHDRAKIVVRRGWKVIQQSFIGGPEGVAGGLLDNDPLRFGNRLVASDWRDDNCRRTTWRCRIEGNP